MKKQTHKDVTKFEDIPNIGPAMVRDFRVLGVKDPRNLAKQNPFDLYKKLSKKKGRQDPCVLDVFMAAVDFMNGAKAKPWWHYTNARKKQFPNI